MLTCAVHGELTDATYETRFGAVCLKCVHRLIQAAQGARASEIWMLDDFKPTDPEPPSVDDDLLKWVVDEAEAKLSGKKNPKLPEPDAEAHVWAAESFLEGGMRRQAIDEAVDAYRKADDDGHERRKAIEILLRPELLKTNSVKELKQLLWG